MAQFIVETSADAPIREFWQVEAENGFQARENFDALVSSGAAVFLFDEVAGEEQGRAVDDVHPIETFAGIIGKLNAEREAPAMLAALRRVAGVMAMTDPESPTFADSGADCIDALLADCAEIPAILARINGEAPTADAPPPTGEPPAHCSRWVSTIIRKSWEPRFSVFDSEEELRADLLNYARDTLEIEGIEEGASVADLADLIGEECSDSVYWGEC
jgi:hypothetical protein